MAIKQLTVFVENKQGTVVSITEILSKNNINLRALSIAETEAFGILRLIVNDEEAAVKALTDAGYLLKVTEVVGVKIGDAPGKLSAVLRVLDDKNINVEYMYAFANGEDASAVLKSDDPEKVVEVLKENGFDVWEADEAYHANC